MDEEEIWKCKSHPSWRHLTGICPICLRNRLIDLCPNCATLLPCLTCPAPYSSSFHIASSESLRSLIYNEPSIKRSTSSVIPGLPTSSRFTDHKSHASAHARRAKTIIFSFFRTNDRGKEGENGGVKSNDVSDDYADQMMRRSRSVGVKMPMEAAKGRAWFFPSPIKAYKQRKMSKVVQERSPMHKA